MNRKISGNRQRKMGVRALLACLALGCATAAQATILSVDFDYTPQLQTQSGFSSFAEPLRPFGSPYSSIPSVSQTFGAYTVTVAPLLGTDCGFYNRNSLTDAGAFTFAGLYNDFVFDNSIAAQINLSITGVTPNTPYALTLYGYDSGNSDSIYTFTPVATTTGDIGTINMIAANTPTFNGQYATTIWVSSTTSTLDILETSSTSSVVLNGFELTGVPEPSVAMLLGLGVMVLWSRRQKTVA